MVGILASVTFSMMQQLEDGGQVKMFYGFLWQCFMVSMCFSRKMSSTYVLATYILFTGLIERGAVRDKDSIF